MHNLFMFKMLYDNNLPCLQQLNAEAWGCSIPSPNLRDVKFFSFFSAGHVFFINSGLK